MMGRSKYSSKGVMYGRNMIITEYLWICHWIVFPPDENEVIPVGKEREEKKFPIDIDKDGKVIYGAHPAYRGRKQVSSHIQVCKGFYLPAPLCKYSLNDLLYIPPDHNVS
jgi:transcriptional enhancer factor